MIDNSYNFIQTENTEKEAEQETKFSYSKLPISNYRK